jgi:hypothetical protein
MNLSLPEGAFLVVFYKKRRFYAKHKAGNESCVLAG